MRILIVLLCSMLFSSCGEVKRLDTSKIKDQMDSYKVKQIRPDEMMSQVRSMGQEAEKTLNQRISCSDLNGLIDSLSKANGAMVEMIDVSTLSLIDTEDKKEKMLYDAYLYAFEQSEVLPSNAQKLTNGTFVYSFGVKSNSLLCDTLVTANRYFWKMTWSQPALLKSF